MPRRPVLENPRPHPVEGRVFEGVFSIGGVQFKRVSGRDFIQVTMLTPMSDSAWRTIGQVAGRACVVHGREAVDPVLTGLFPGVDIPAEQTNVVAPQPELLDGIPPDSEDRGTAPQ